ncbi:MAG: Unknown protein, partial [uncultured Aureispira sp.]
LALLLLRGRSTLERFAFWGRLQTQNINRLNYQNHF